MTLNKLVIAVIVILGVSLCIPCAAAADWQEQIYAPYIDISLNTPVTINSVYEETGVKYFTLAFLNIDKKSGKLTWGWKPVDEAGGSKYYKDEIDKFRAKGGDVIISFGGAEACAWDLEPAQNITNLDELVEAYSHVIDSYDANYIDFDIEHKGVIDKESINRRNQAILKLKEKYPNLKVSTTLAVSPTGFVAQGHELNYLKSAMDAEAEYKKSTGKDVRLFDRVNIMLMDYGEKYLGDMGKYAIDASNGVHTQLSQGYYKGMSDAEIWKRMGLTPMIGQNDQPGEIFTLDNGRQLAAFAGDKGAGMMSIWSMARDRDCSKVDLVSTCTCSDITQEKYEFTNILKNYASMSTSDVGTTAKTPMSTTVWPDQIYAPYIDYGLWQGCTINEVYDATGVKYYTLAFISVNDAGQLRFAAHPEADYKLNDVKALRANGGDVIISFGGANACGYGNEPAQRITDVDELVKAYSSVIDTYGVNYIDFDIEGNAVSEQGANSRRNLAILKLKEKYPGLKVSATLAVSTVGFPGEQIAFLSDAKSVEDRAGTGVQIFDRVNIMLMDYGESFQGDMGEYAISASNGVHTQLSQGYYKGKSGAEIWKRMGLTPMIGQNDIEVDGIFLEFFTQDNARQLAEFAGSKGAGMMSVWAMTRDNGNCPGNTDPLKMWSCSGIEQDLYEFSNIFKNYYSDYSYVETPTPTPTLTPAPTPTHATGLIPKWDSEKEYDTGDTVLYNKEMYAARYWTMGEEPGIEYVWMLTYGEPIPTPTPDTGLLREWDSTKIYLPDESVLYDGDMFSARWLTMGEKPGATYVWDLVSDTKPTPAPTVTPTPTGVIPTPTPATGLLMEWKSTTLYHTDDRVLYKGEIYIARWATRNEKPGDAYVWALTTGGAEPSPTPDTGLPTEWDSQTAYHTGDKVIYKGHMYRASWWTKGEVPGLAYVWELADSGPSPTPTPSGGLLPTPTYATGLLPVPTPATGLLG